MTEQDSIASRELFIAAFAHGRATKLLTRSLPQLVRAMKDVHLGAGDALFRIGDPADAVYFIATGRVDVQKNGVHMSYGERNVVGTSDVLLERARTQDAIAVTELHVLELPVTSWLEILEDNVDAARTALGNISAMIDSFDLKRPPHEDDEASRGETLPKTMTLVDRLVILRRAPVLRHARIQTLASLAAGVDVVRLAAGEKLFGADAQRRAFYVVAHGRIETTRVDPVRTDHFGAGDLVLGAAGFVPTAAFDAVATTESIVFRMNEEEFLDVSEDHFDLIRSVFTWLEEQRDAFI